MTWNIFNVIQIKCVFVQADANLYFKFKISIYKKIKTNYEKLLLQNYILDFKNGLFKLPNHLTGP